MFKIIASIAGIQIIQAVVYVLKMKFVALMMGPDGLGALGLINQFIQLVIQVSTLSLPWIATRYLAIAYADGLEKFSHTTRLFLRAILFLSVGGTIVSVFTITQLDYLLPEALHEYLPIALISTMLVIPMTLKAYVISVFTAAGKYYFSAVTQLLGACVTTVSVLIGAWYYQVTGFFVGMAIAEYVVTFYCLVKLRSELGIPPWPARTSSIRGIFGIKGAMELMGYGCVLYWLHPAAQSSIRFGLLLAGGATLVGHFHAAHALVLYMATALNQATNLYLDPIVKRDSPFEEKIIIANQYFRSISVIAVTAALIFVIIPEVVLVSFYSTAFLPATRFLFAFCAIEILNVASSVYLGFLVGQGWYRTHFILGIVAHSILIAFGLLILPTTGVWGAVLALGVVAVFTNILIYARMFYTYGAFWNTGHLVHFFLLLSVLTVAGLYISNLPFSGGWVPEELLHRLGFMLLYTVVLVSGLTKHEKGRVIALVMRHVFKRC